MSLIDICKENAAVHIEVYPRFDYDGTSWSLETPDGKTYFDGIDQYGLYYLAYRLKYSSYRHLVKNPKELCKELNRGFKNLASRKTYVAAFTRKGTNLFLSGFLTNYLPKHHWEVVEFLEKNGYFPVEYKVSTYEMKLYFEGKSYKDISFGCVLHNGETGHVSIGYRLYLKTGKLTIDVPFIHRNRHQSRVEDTLDNLQAIFDEISRLNIEAILDLPTATFVGLINDIGGEKFAPYYLQYAELPIAFFLAELGELVEKRGFKTVGTELVEKLTQAIVNRANS